MTTLIKYAVPCISEGTIVISGYRENVPSHCPNSVDHTINSAGIQPLDSVLSKQIYIGQNAPTVPVGGYFSCEQINVNVAASSITNYDVSFPYNINAFTVTFLPSAENIGDIINIVTIPNTPIGGLLANISSGVNTLNISNVNLVSYGFSVSITDGINTDDLGEITSIDIVNNTITCSVNTVNNFNAGSVILIGIPRVKNFLITKAGIITLGIAKIGSSGLPSNKISRLIYTNNSSSDKTFAFMMEIEK